MSTALERTLERIKTAATWPDWPLQGRASRAVPDWAEHFIHWAFQFTGQQLGHVDAFEKVPIVNSCVNDLIDDVSAIPLRVYRGRGPTRTEIEPTGRPVEVGGNLADLLTRANDLDTGRQLRGAVVGSLALNGNGYWHMLRLSPEKPPVSLMNLPGQLVRPVPGPKGMVGRTVAGFEFDRGGRGLFTPLTAESVLHFRRFNPRDEPVGMSRLEAVRLAYESQYYALMWVREFFRKGGVLSGVWSTKEVAGVQTKVKDPKLWAQEMVKQYYGVDKAFQPVLVNGLEFIKVGMTLSEMELDKQIVMIEAQIIRALGMPPVQVGTKEGGGLSDAGAKVDLTNYWTRTIPGYTSLIDDVINEKLAILFGPQFYVAHDLESVLAIQNARLAQAQTNQALTGARQVLAVNEARRSMGLPPSPDPEDEILHNDKPVPGFDEEGFPIEPKGGEEPEAGKPGKAKEKLAEDPRLELRRREQFRLSKFRDAFLRLHRARFDAQWKKALERLAELYPQPLAERVRLAIDWGSLLEATEDDEVKAQRMFEELIKQRGLDALRDIAAAAGTSLEVEIDVTQGRWQAFVLEMVDRSIRVPDETTKTRLREKLADVLAEGGALAELRAAVDEVFEGRRGNALTIARTETLAAYNFGALQAWRDSGVVERSMWLTSRSGTGGRHSEDPEGRYAASDGGRGLDGQVRTLGDPFDVGGIALLYPGDPSAPPSEICNCVCTLVPDENEAAALRERVQAITLARTGKNGNGHKLPSRLGAYFVGRVG